MPKKYMIIACLSIAVVFVFLYGFNYGDADQIISAKPSSDTKVRQKAKLAQLSKSDDMVGAIVIMPKSYLPALKRFSQSKMAKNITILRAQIEVQDGIMTAVHQNGVKKQRVAGNPPLVDAPEKFEDTRPDEPTPIDKPILATGILYLLASAHKARTLN